MARRLLGVRTELSSWSVVVERRRSRWLSQDNTCRSSHSSEGKAICIDRRAVTFSRRRQPLPKDAVSHEKTQLAPSTFSSVSLPSVPPWLPFSLVEPPPFAKLTRPFRDAVSSNRRIEVFKVGTSFLKTPADTRDLSH